MRSLALISLVGAAACGGEPRVVLELTGAAQGAERVEVKLLQPIVLAKEQRHNDTPRNADGILETVFYMAERASTTIELGGGPTEGFQLEIREPGGPYVPLVIVRAADRVLAMGLHDPDSVFAAKLGEVHTPSVVKPVRDVTIYPIQLEPVTRVFSPVSTEPPEPPVVRPGEVMLVRCGDDGSMISGLVWRRADQRQLRVLAPSRGGEDRLDPPDLDCDEHSPGRGAIPRHDPGDQRDCDDTAAAIHGGAREQCSEVDMDCNPGTTIDRVECTGGCLSNTCVCVKGGPSQICVESVKTCEVPADSSGPELKPCDSAGTVKLTDCLAPGCVVTLAMEPVGLEVFLAAAEGQMRHGVGEPITLTGDTVHLAVHATRSFSDPMLVDPIVLRVVPPGLPLPVPAVQVIRVQLSGSGDGCSAADEITCQ
jgi:hypothetical protein